MTPWGYANYGGTAPSNILAKLKVKKVVYKPKACAKVCAKGMVCDDYTASCAWN